MQREEIDAPAGRAHGRSVIPGLAVWAFFLTFSGQGIRNVVGWMPFGIIAAISGIALYVAFRLEGHRIVWRALPPATCAYCLWCVASIAWTQFPDETLLASALMVATTAAGILLACALSLRQLTVALGRSLEATIALSLALEAYVALVLKHPLVPLYMRGWESVPISYFWSEDRLLQGGPIQGIVGNRNPLAFIALLALICVVVRWRDRQISRSHLVVWSSLSVLTLILTRSATVTVAAVICAVLAVVLWWLRHVPRDQRYQAILRTAGACLLLGLVALLFRHDLAMLLNRSPDMSGRALIWERVIDLWQQHSILGWGWVMYWQPWLPVFQTLVVRPDGTPTMSAHNAYLEALFQTGIVGFVLIVTVVLLLLVRTGRLALLYLDSAPSVLLPLLVSTALAIQALTESRLLSEGNWMVACAIGTWLGLHRLMVKTAERPTQTDIKEDPRE